MTRSELFGITLEVLGLLITAATFWRVTTVRKAQAEERQLIRQLYGTDTLAERLTSAATYLRLGPDTDAKTLAEELVRLVGQIEGITRVLEALQEGRRRPDRSFSVSDENYFTLESIRKDLRSARSVVDFLMYRNMFISSPGIVEAMESAAGRGVRMRVLCISSSAADDVLGQALNILPRPVPDSASEFRDQLRNAEDRIKRIVGREWSAGARRRFEYRGYITAPVWHLVRIDGLIKLGFVGTATAAQPARYEDRPYVSVPTSSVPGSILMRHIDELWQSSASHVLSL